MRILYVVPVLFCCFFLMGVAGSQAKISADSTSYEHRLEEGIDAFYKSKWVKAQRIFDALKQQQPTDSRAYFFDSMIPFWKYYFGEKSSEAAEEFMQRSQKAIEVSTQQLNENSSDTTMVLMLSGLYGYQSLVLATEENYRAALQGGMTGFKYTRQLLSINDDNPKALIGKGIFYYMIGSVPNGLKWVTNMVGISADMQEGLEVLEQAANSDSYISNDAKMILAYLYEREEKYDRSLTHLEELCERYPENIIFQYNRARLLEKNNQPTLARKKYQQIVKMNTQVLEILQQKSKARLHNL
ncbi:tetratricopeptide repeat protein [Fodinibius sp. Rm-B-1B1-1]|uniref:tetratricopeptide repeat protein n=1 Tax=Fodinibius alkaliphilus TaxID=3140241 RepID=UPI003159E2CF